MFKTIRFSIKKSKILTKIRKASEPKNYDTQSVLDRTMKSAVSGNTLSEKELYTEELLTLLSKDKATTNLLTKRNLKFDDLRDMISILEQHGAGQIVKGHYVPVSSIAFIDTLNILCNYWDNDGFIIEDKSKIESNDAMAYQMIKSF
ncbi:hypothetical protein [uncultured Psychroserpens sp.]|uniref:hypothetical protein n=1 Tax=uncultured Psychroserpens sp. TaxID=255436 RepID=UPI002635F072|nr:hypothetical protein [uncultured Psychroserpens sp.]